MTLMPHTGPDGEDHEPDIDDDWDWDTELGLLMTWDPEPPRQPWVPPPRTPPALLERDREAVSVDTGSVGDFLRACRASAGFSQRDLAREAGVPQSTVARIESGASDDPGLATLTRLANACGVTLVGLAGDTLLEGDRAQRHRDTGERMLPAHLTNRPVTAAYGDWWGDYRYTHGRRRPYRSFGRRDLYRDLAEERVRDRPAPDERS
jgi:transcriptional regulator with XRE-family HTH domain